MIALLIDADNFSSPAWVNEALVILERNEGSVAIRRAYGSVENIKGLAEVLRSRAVRPFVNLQLPKNTTDVSLAIDAMELACLTPLPMTIVIASGDMDFVPLVVRLRERGIKVVCVSERTKIALDAIPAYDDVIYVGAQRTAGDSKKADEPETTSEQVTCVTPKKATVKVISPKLNAPAPEANETVTKAKKIVPTLEAIIEALPDLRARQWIHLSEAAKVSREKKLLAKTAQSTKLFKRFPLHFKLKPATKPNQVLLIGSSRN